MGGSISLIIREPDGTTHRRVSWTNCLPGFINDMRVVNKDVAYVHNYLKVHCDRYEETFKESKAAAPVSYGIVVIDMQKDHILHSQGYTSNIGSFYKFDMFGGGPNRNHSNVNWRPKLQKFFKLGRVKGARTHGDFDRNDKAAEIKRTIVKVKTLRGLDRLTDRREQAYEESRPLEDLPPGMTVNGQTQWRKGTGDPKLFAKTIYEVVLDMSPFKVIRYPEGEKGLVKVFKKMLALGFDLSVEDRKAWAALFEEREYKPFDFLTESTNEVHRA
jgi:hypothetical protein